MQKIIPHNLLIDHKQVNTCLPVKICKKTTKNGLYGTFVARLVYCICSKSYYEHEIENKTAKTKTHVYEIAKNVSAYGIKILSIVIFHLLILLSIHQGKSVQIDSTYKSPNKQKLY